MRRLFGITFLFLAFHQVSSEYSWPAGTYGLPETATGCPYIGKASSWKRGFTYHNTEDEFPANKRSQSYHFAANFSQHGIQQRFCIKDQPSSNENGGKWPDGKYCIYKKGDSCPEGLEEGFIRWDDEHRKLDRTNQRSGVLPAGEYLPTKTVINYCCQRHGDVMKAINLPNMKPFYLLAHGGPQCQHVAGTRASLEFIKFDDNDRGSQSGFGGAHPYGPEEDLFNTKVYYCYYEPGEESTEDLGLGKKVITKEKPHSRTGLALAIGCGVLGVVLGTASIVFAAQRIMARRAEALETANEEYPDIPKPDLP
ncbi:uncharacterized protein [Clytia hemisphaerica]|uniref:uncharacterized protein isoform X2 n=1 Tax=Clytia hemisphaerica TaxID=252671 RepID=UPI0034D5814B|eukprot:TCONS_00021750-protein